MKGRLEEFQKDFFEKTRKDSLREFRKDLLEESQMERMKDESKTNHRKKFIKNSLGISEQTSGEEIPGRNQDVILVKSQKGLVEGCYHQIKTPRSF